MTDAAFALYAAAECFACAHLSSDLDEEGVEYAEAAIAALPPGGYPRPDYVRELVEARDWRYLEMISRELDRRARPVRVSQERMSESFDVSKPAKRKRKPRIRESDGLRTASEAAAKLGCSIKTLKGHVASGAVRYVITGHGTKRPRKMFTDADLNKFIEAQTRKDSPPCPSASRTRPTGTMISSGEVVAFTARPRKPTSAKPKK
jgi:hypothetical protein